MKLKLLAFCALALTMMPAAARGQSATTGAIAGTAKDATGGILPGVTVEAASPALIEKVRTAVTDAQGNYKIVELRPGTYTVTFSLPGFGTYKREGIELTSGLTASINAELKVGSLEETVTVSAGSPVVDIQNVRTQTVLSRDLLDALPVVKTLQSYATLTLGATFSNPANQDVGGNQGEAGGFGAFSVHGNRGGDSRMTIDGMPFYPLSGNSCACNRTNYVNQMAVAETVIQISGAGADIENGGVQMNIVPKDGSNTLSGSSVINGTSGSLQNDNLTDELRARGASTAPKVKTIYDQGIGMGGPLVKDKLWFYTAHRRWGSQNTVPGFFFNATPNTLFYTPDRSKPAFTWIHNRDHQGRVTWQVTGKQKVTISQGFQFNSNRYYRVDGLRSPEASTWLKWSPNSLTQATWTYPRTNKLLFEAGATTLYENQEDLHTAGAKPTDIPVTELTTGFTWGATPGRVFGGQTDYTPPGKPGKHHNSNQRASVSYVTGSHAVKVGMFMMEGWGKVSVQNNETPYGPVDFSFRNGVPAAITQVVSPHTVRFRLMPNLGVFAQDQWTIRRVTLNAGVRWDHQRQYIPAETLPANAWVGERKFAMADNVPLWNDVSPRIGAAYDMFGNGRTAVKGSFGRFVEQQTNGLGAANAPANRVATTATRTWADANTDYVPNCDLKNPEANGECGRLSNVNLGLPIPATTFDPEFLKGFGVRPYNWQTALTLQQQLWKGASLNLGYFRTWYGNFTVTANQAVATTDFDSYCITAPTDSRLGDASGKQLCGFYDVKPAMFGRVSNFVTNVDAYGKQTEVYDGIDVALNARFGKNGLLMAGVNTGKTVVNSCDLVRNNPQIALNISNVVTSGLNAGGAGARANDDFCKVTNPWRGQTQFKLALNYTLPLGLQASATYQNLPGIPIQALLPATNAQIAPSLGRNLSAGANAVQSIALIQPGTMFEDRITQLDVRLSKRISIGRFKVQGQFDIYNAFNASPILSENFTYGSAWLRPTAILGARLFKFGTQIDF